MAEILEAERLEHHARRHHGLHAIDKFAAGETKTVMPIEFIPYLVLELADGGIGDEIVEIIMQRPDIWRNGHAVIVQDDEYVLLQHAAIIQRLIRDAARHRAIANHSRDLEIFAGKIPRRSDTECRADRGRSMSRAEDIILALFTL